MLAAAEGTADRVWFLQSGASCPGAPSCRTRMGSLSCSRSALLSDSSQVKPPHRGPSTGWLFGEHTRTYDTAPVTKSLLQAEQPSSRGTCWLTELLGSGKLSRASLHTPPPLGWRISEGQMVKGRRGQEDLGASPHGWWDGSGAASLPNGLDVPQHVPRGVTVWPSNPTPRCGPRRTERTSTQMRRLECSRQRGCSRQKPRQNEPAGLSSGGRGLPEVSMGAHTALCPTGSLRPPAEHPSPHNGSSEGQAHQSPPQPSPGPLPGRCHLGREVTCEKAIQCSF